MILRRSRFLHLVPVGEARVLVIHAITQVRLPADPAVAALLTYFETPRAFPAAFDEIAELLPDVPRETIEATVVDLFQRAFLTPKTPDEETAEIGQSLSGTYGRDPAEMLDRYRRARKEGVTGYWSVEKAYGLRTTAAATKLSVILLGDCDIQMEGGFLKSEAETRGIDLTVAASFPDDLSLLAERPHDAVIVGALRARYLIAGDKPAGIAAHEDYIAHALHLLTHLRAQTRAPVFIDNLPEPTVQPMGLAERGIGGHRTRYRLANVALAELAAELPDVYVIDTDAALSAAGNARLVDDGQVGFDHFGSPGWLLQRPEREKAAVHGLFPDLAPLAEALGGDAYARERLMAAAHVDALVTVAGIGRKKCVILDLDGTLWPGVLAETGSPFAWEPEISGNFSFIGYYFGLHEALKMLKARGIVLACVSKNDEATVRDLWRYPDHYPKDRLLTLDDFVTTRINWTDKPANIASIADELGFALDAFLFLDDNPVERDRVRQMLPEVEVWGEEPLDFRRRLLTDPRLQLPVVTAEASGRTDLVKAQLDRKKQEAIRGTLSEADYLASLQIEIDIEALAPQSAKLARVEELFQRTTQFNTTGYKPTSSELGQLIANGTGHVFVLTVRDRFGDHGVVGAIAIEGTDILGLAMSCRVLGMGVEHRFLQDVITRLTGSIRTLSGRIIETSRNLPVRNIYRDNGFKEGTGGLWSRALDTREAAE
jgi:FkbH-like protein